MPLELAAQIGGDAYQCQPNAQMPGGNQRAVHDVAWREIATHRVNSDVHRSSGPRVSRFLDCANLTTLVEPTVRTDAMRQLDLVTLRALTYLNGVQPVVGATLSGTALGMPTFGIWHSGRGKRFVVLGSWFLVPGAERLALSH